MTALEEKYAIQTGFRERMDEDELLNCMRCGFCLPACPTYITSGYDEAQSPRGRIALMKAVRDGMIEWDDDVDRSLGLCLGCRACEPVCPAGVKYGHLLEEARDIIQDYKNLSLPVNTIRKAIFQGLFPHQDRMQTVTGLLGFYQKSGLQTIVRKIGFMKLFPVHLASMEQILPKVPSKKDMMNRPRYLEPAGEKCARVGFFSGCLMETMFMDTNNSTLKLLQLAGCEIIIPKDQSCCGALHGHSGEKQGSIELAKKNIQAFEELNVDYIITNAGGCGAFLIDYHHLLSGDPEWAERARQFTEKIKDFTEILVDLDFHKKAELKLDHQIVTYQDSCHLRNVMKTFSAPRLLLSRINGITFKEMKDAGSCCGSAGIYNIVEPEMSMRILDTKMGHTKASCADTVVTANPGCLLQMKLGIVREGMSDQMEAVHIADLLLEAVQ